MAVNLSPANPPPPPTVTSLSRWSASATTPPAAEKIRVLHVYDFDNTVFRTPLPNEAIWHSDSIGHFYSEDAFVNGGWWHDPSVLSSTGEGDAKEELRAWDGWWNEKVVSLVKLSMRQDDALCVLLTGRSERNFADLVKRMVASKGLVFDLTVLKPAVSPTNTRFANTLEYKKEFLEAAMETYSTATEIRLYEDRPRHVQAFRNFFSGYNYRQTAEIPTRGPISFEVVPVAEIATKLDPVAEVAQVQCMISRHNDAIVQGLSTKKSTYAVRRSVLSTAYMIDRADTRRLTGLVTLPSSISRRAVVFQATSISICNGACQFARLEEIGGVGGKMQWEVTGTAFVDESVWVASLRPVPPEARVHTDYAIPLVVLAVKKGSRQNIDFAKIDNWRPLPPDAAFTFQTTIDERSILHVEPEGSHKAHRAHENKRGKRKYKPESNRAACSGTHQGFQDGPQNYRNAQHRVGGHGSGRGNHSLRGALGRGLRSGRGARAGDGSITSNRGHGVRPAVEVGSRGEHVSLDAPIQSSEYDESHQSQQQPHHRYQLAALPSSTQMAQSVPGFVSHSGQTGDESTYPNPYSWTDPSCRSFDRSRYAPPVPGTRDEGYGDYSGHH